MKIPKAVGPYSPFIKTGNFIFCSGQVGVSPDTNKLVEGIENQTHQALKNVSAVLEEAGSNLDNVVKTTIFLTNINDFAKVNEIYGSYFTKQKPARSTIEVSNLPKGALIEIEAISTLK
jgi:2-iminobutanoate/2-iminopropanoate deaminase